MSSCYTVLSKHENFEGFVKRTYHLFDINSVTKNEPHVPKTLTSTSPLSRNQDIFALKTTSSLFISKETKVFGFCVLYRVFYYFSSSLTEFLEGPSLCFKVQQDYIQTLNETRKGDPNALVCTLQAAPSLWGLHTALVYRCAAAALWVSPYILIFYIGGCWYLPHLKCNLLLFNYKTINVSRSILLAI